MKRYWMAGVAGVVMLGLGSPALAEPDGWYGAVDLGYHWKDDLGTFSENDAPDGGPYNFNWSTEDSWAGFVRLGYRFNPNWRVELEGGYRPGDIDAVRGYPRTLPASEALCTPGVIRTASDPCGSPEGSIEQWTLMGNLIYDFGNEDWAFRPFIGVGAGFNRVSVDAIGQFSTSSGATPENLQVDDSDTAFAWQALAGFAWALSDRLLLDVTARYLDTSEITFDSTSASANPAWQPGAFEGDFTDTSVTVGLRWAFGSNPPPPPPPPPPVTPPPPPPVTPTPAPTPPPPPPARPAARQFTVLFDWDRYNLTADAERIVQEAANYARSGNATRVHVVGHTDTSGSAAYNVRLSQRRAATVRDALVANGVNASTITTDARGETDLARPTPDGVREPLNRRAVIDINF